MSGWPQMHNRNCSSACHFFVQSLRVCSTAPSTCTYTARSGDFAWAIAQAYRTDVATLQNLNPTATMSNLWVGQVRRPVTIDSKSKLKSACRAAAWKFLALLLTEEGSHACACWACIALVIHGRTLDALCHLQWYRRRTAPGKPSTWAPLEQ